MIVLKPHAHLAVDSKIWNTHASKKCLVECEIFSVYPCLHPSFANRASGFATFSWIAADHIEIGKEARSVCFVVKRRFLIFSIDKVLKYVWFSLSLSLNHTAEQALKA